VLEFSTLDIRHPPSCDVKHIITMEIQQTIDFPETSEYDGVISRS